MRTPKQWIIALGSYGYDWTIGGKRAELISFPEAMSRGTNAEVDNADHVGPDYNPYFYFEENDKEHAVWFLDAITFLNELREVREQKAGGIAIYRLGTEDAANLGCPQSCPRRENRQSGARVARQNPKRGHDRRRR